MKHGKKHGQRSFSRGFWQTGCTEIFECISYYMGKSLILIFTTESVAQGGLGLTAAQGAALQSLFIAFAFFGPLVGGATAGWVRDMRHQLVWCWSESDTGAALWQDL